MAGNHYENQNPKREGNEYEPGAWGRFPSREISNLYRHGQEAKKLSRVFSKLSEQQKLRVLSLLRKGAPVNSCCAFGVLC